MSIARHHAEWLSLVETSGPFLSMPVLIRAFPQGLDARDPEKNSQLRQAFEEWEDSRQDPSIHYAWIKHVLHNILEFTDDTLAEGQSIPPGLEVLMSLHGEILRPDLAVLGPKGTPEEGKPRLLICVLPFEQQLEKPLQGKHWKVASATRMMEMLHATDVSLGLITNGEHWMLVHAPRGEATGFASWYATLWIEEPITFQAFCSLLSLRRFFGVSENETIEALLSESAHDQQEVTDQLGFQVRRAVEVLVRTLDKIDHKSGRTLLEGVGEKELYAGALTLMMRLVFLFSAEERDLLLLHNALYDQYYAVSTLRDQLREVADQHGEEILERHCDAWSRLLATFRAVYAGVEHVAMRLPPYGGNLFDPDRYPFLEGRKLGSSWQDVPADPLAVDNRTVLHLLESLQMLQIKVPGGGPAEARRISFRALDIEQIGHVYEGLLDHTAVRTEKPVLSLIGSKNDEPDIPLADLEDLYAQGIKVLVNYLKDVTGRTPGTLERALTEDADTDHQRLLISCGNDQELYERVKPFAKLLRNDTFDYPVVVREGSVYITKGEDRRSTGTHYTPRSLTEPIVKHTLDPLVYEGPSEGKLEDDWRLKSAKEILDLKVCDMTMGSGAFLVQACRYLSERLVEAWEEAESSTPGAFLITPEGDLSTGSPTERIIPADPDERLAIARRYVADRCLYGVDKNPMAVEMAKLSLWLITLQKDRPFNFLDHAIKCGDSLIGISDLEQIRTFSLSKEQGNKRLMLQFLEEHVDSAIKIRSQLENMPSNDYWQLTEKNRLHHEAEEAISKLRFAADMLIAAEMSPGSARVKESVRLDAQLQVVKNYHHETFEAFRKLSQERLNGQRTFHWPLEFPEVFKKGGFDVMASNPPFMGGSKITNALGTHYRDHILNHIAQGRRGKADLCVYFILRAYSLLSSNGNLGFIATSSIAEGDARRVGLSHIINQMGGTIYRANANAPWPGSATVTVALIWLHVGSWAGLRILDNSVTENISSALLSSDEKDHNRYELAANSSTYFRGTEIKGLGFVLEQSEAQRLLNSDLKNHDIIFPYVTGSDLNSTPDQSGTRYVINFHNWPYEKAKEYKECMSIVTERVKPYRDTLTEQIHEPDYWKFWDKRLANYQIIMDKTRVIAISLVTNHVSFAFVPAAGWVYAHKIVIIMSDAIEILAVLQSNFQYVWAWEYSPRNLSLLAYSPAECIAKFPLPKGLRFGFDIKPQIGPLKNLAVIGSEYYRHRQHTMLSQQIGLTEIYNQVHDDTVHSSDIEHLRELQIKMDNAVAIAYDWNDLVLAHDFHATKQGPRFTISGEARRLILDRLFNLNNERYKQELDQGFHGNENGNKKNKAKKAGKNQGDLDLFD